MTKFERRASPIRELAQNPDISSTANALSNSTKGLHEVAPNIAQSLQITGTRAINFLHSKMPKPSNELIGDQEYEPSKTSQRNWLNLHEIVDDPVSALDHVRHGTLTSAHMEALQSVHPELLSEMQQKVMENMDPNQIKKLPSSTKKSLSTFLQNPVSQSQSPQAVLSNQAIIQGTKPQMAQGNSKSPLGGLKELKFGERSATETNSLETED